MNLLELFSGTGSVGTIAKSLGYNVISLDLKNADINCDILNGIINNLTESSLLMSSGHHPRALNTAKQKQQE